MNDKIIIPKFTHQQRVEIVYPELRGKLMETEDPDIAFEWLAYCIQAGMITAGKAQKIFDRRFPKETTQFFKEKVVEYAVKETEGERLKREAVANRQQAIKNLGFEPEAFEKQMEEKVRQASVDAGDIG